MVTLFYMASRKGDGWMDGQAKVSIGKIPTVMDGWSRIFHGHGHCKRDRLSDKDRPKTDSRSFRF